MKKCKHITCWTDYPFVELGDMPGKPAPIRHVNVIAYDGNKYVTVSFEDNGSFLGVKAGYLYSKPGRYGQVPTVNIRKIERMGNGKRARETDKWNKHWKRLLLRDLERERQVINVMRKRGLNMREAYDFVEARNARA